MHINVPFLPVFYFSPTYLNKNSTSNPSGIHLYFFKTPVSTVKFHTEPNYLLLHSFIFVFFKVGRLTTCSLKIIIMPFFFHMKNIRKTSKLYWNKWGLRDISESDKNTIMETYISLQCLKFSFRQACETTASELDECVLINWNLICNTKFPFSCISTTLSTQYFIRIATDQFPQTTHLYRWNCSHPSIEATTI